MCGIVGYVGTSLAAPIVLDGLQMLEYRGYDSAGLAVIDSGQIKIQRAVGKLIHLRACYDAAPLAGSTGIGHTRWATHGVPAEHNAHPHASADGAYVVVHNGIVENYLALRQELAAEGISFRSETDSEVIAHLIALYAAGSGKPDLTEAVRRAASRLKGAQAILAISAHQPDRMVVVRLGYAGGIAVGIGQGEVFVASDLTAILNHTHDVILLDDRQLATVTVDHCDVQTLDGSPVSAKVHSIAWDNQEAARGTYQHFMQKEIFEQPLSLTATVAGRADFERGTVQLPELNLTAERARSLQRLVIVACGTSYYSALVGKFFIERLAGLPVEVDYASEYRYREPLVDENSAVLAITQSGETVDTLAAMEWARRGGATVMAIVNAIGSQATRLAHGYIPMNAGPEIGVASTKAFTASLVDQYLLALYLAQLRGSLPDAERKTLVQDLALLPALAGRALEQDAAISSMAELWATSTSSLFIGRGVHYPIALEGALKLKEISYVHAEGYPAGEMKHGPIALVDAETPVLAIAPCDGLHDKMISQIEQVKARGGVVVALATEHDPAVASRADAVIELPEMPLLLSPIIAVIPLQLLAYHVALLRGCDVDQPRNLAKSVTVE